MKLLEAIENKINGWLFKEEIEDHIANKGQAPQPSDAEMEAEMKRMEKVHEEQVELIKAEDHTNAPTPADIKRYYGYHDNFVNNMKLFKETTGKTPPFNVPSNPLGIVEFTEKAQNKGWVFLRMSCGLPTGDLTKPRKPWTMGDGDKAWKVDSDPEIHWKTKE